MKLLLPFDRGVRRTRKGVDAALVPLTVARKIPVDEIVSRLEWKTL